MWVSYATSVPVNPVAQGFPSCRTPPFLPLIAKLSGRFRDFPFTNILRKPCCKPRANLAQTSSGISVSSGALPCPWCPLCTAAGRRSGLQLPLVATQSGPGDQSAPSRCILAAELPDKRLQSLCCRCSRLAGFSWGHACPSAQRLRRSFPKRRRSSLLSSNSRVRSASFRLPLPSAACTLSS